MPPNLGGMETSPEFAFIAGNIELAIAPVFLIAGIGALLNVLTNRLARVVDRGRALEREIASEPEGEPREMHKAELAGLDTRMVRINRAIMLATLAALLICLVIVLLFTGELVHIDLSDVIAALFIGAMVTLILGLMSFMGEIAISARTLRVTRQYRGKGRGR